MTKAKMKYQISLLNGFVHTMEKLKTKEFNKVLLVATGALMSTTVNQQGETIPCVAHLVQIQN